jgi:RNA methyltransferase, TrmH family
MISKNRSKFILSLRNKKVRDLEKLFVIEGDKIVREFLSARETVRYLYATEDFLQSLTPVLLKNVIEKEVVNENELKKISSLTTPHNALAVILFSENHFDSDKILSSVCAALDVVQDPGNLGTIIRAAAWFGIKNIVCSKDCADVHNPKTVQASMGAILHVNVWYHDLKELLIIANRNKIPVYGAVLEGDSIYNKKTEESGIILLGNESKGISEELMPFITDKIKIPGIAGVRPGIESLNVGMAASVIFSEFLRKSEIRS